MKVFVVEVTGKIVRPLVAQFLINGHEIGCWVGFWVLKTIQQSERIV
jgi:hypothetical protein